MPQQEATPQRRNRLFDVKEDVARLQEEASAAPFKSKYLATHFKKLESLEKDLHRLPTRDEFIFCHSEASFNAFTFIPFIAKPLHIEHLYATTYSISRRVIAALMEMHDKGMIARITLSISDSMIKRNPVTIDNLVAMAASRPNIEVVFSWVHAKVALVKTEEAHYVIEGSGNWSENAKFEQYLFAESKGLFDFRLELFSKSKIRYRAIKGKLEKLK